MSNISTYSATAANNNSAPPNGAPEGMQPSAVNDTMREIMSGIAKWYAGLKGALVTTGTSTAYVLTTGSSHATLAAIGLVVFRIHTASGAAPTLAVDGLTAKEIRWNGIALTAAALTQDELHAAVYNATADVYDLITTPHNIPSLKAGGLTYPTTDGTSGQYLTTNGSASLSFADAVQTLNRSARTSNTILAVGDKGKLIEATSGTYSQTLTAAATLGAGWFAYLKNSGTGVITIDPNGSETIDGATTYTLQPGDMVGIQCDGSNFYTFFRQGASVGGSLVLLSTVTTAGAASVDIETGFGSAYDNYLIVAHGLTTAGVENIQARWKLGGSYITTSTYLDADGSGGSDSVTADTLTAVTSAGVSAMANGAMTYEVFGANAAVAKFGRVRSQSVQGTPTLQCLDASHYNTGTGALSGVRFYGSGGGNIAGTFYLYAYKKA